MPQPKNIVFATNYNGKLATDCFIHIDVAPRSSVTQSVLDHTDVLIRTADDSHPPVHCRLVDLLRLPLHRLVAAISWPSHGMAAADLIETLKAARPDLIDETEMAAYFYQKNKNPQI